jgi:ABC-2 type transport system permease protein
LRERPSVGAVLAASLRRSLAEEASEITPNVLYVLSLTVGILSQAFFARLVDAAPNVMLGAYQGHFAAFLLLGVSLLDVQNATVGGLSRAIREAQMSGSLESLLATPTPTGLVLAALMLPASVAALARMVVYGIVGKLLFGLTFANVSPLGVLVMLVASFASFAAFTLVGAALTMILRRADPLSRLIAAMSVVAGGVFYPSTVLPKWLAAAGRFLPIAPALEGLRAAVMHDAGPADLEGPIVRLGLVIVVAGPLGAWLFGRMIARARVDGSMTAW